MRYSPYNLVLLQHYLVLLTCIPRELSPNPSWLLHFVRIWSLLAVCTVDLNSLRPIADTSATELHKPTRITMGIRCYIQSHCFCFFKLLFICRNGFKAIYKGELCTQWLCQLKQTRTLHAYVDMDQTWMLNLLSVLSQVWHLATDSIVCL